MRRDFLVVLVAWGAVLSAGGPVLAQAPRPAPGRFLFIDAMRLDLVRMNPITDGRLGFWDPLAPLLTFPLVGPYDSLPARRIPVMEWSSPAFAESPG